MSSSEPQALGLRVEAGERREVSKLRVGILGGEVLELATSSATTI